MTEAVKLTKAQRRFLVSLIDDEPDAWADCFGPEFRMAAVLWDLGLVLIDEPPARMTMKHHFNAKITPTGRALLKENGDG